jgi:hypothetical protein
MSLPSKLKKLLDFVLGLLTLLKWLPFLGKWRPLIIALSTVLGTLSAIKCDPPASKEPPKTAPSEPTATPIHTPSPSPSPTPKPLPRIIIDKVLHVGKPFSVKYTGEYQYNVSLYVDEYRLGFMGKDLDGTFVLNAVVLNTAGDRVISLRDQDGNTIVSAEIRINESLGKN